MGRLSSARSQARRLLTGIEIPQQYVCLALEDLVSPLSVTLTTREGFVLDVTAGHLFLGYQPLIIAIPLSAADAALADAICLNFHEGAFAAKSTWRGFPAADRCPARLVLRKIREHGHDGGRLVFYQGAHGEHRFIATWRQRLNRQRERLRRKAPENIELTGNLRDQVRIAYAVARPIALMALSDGKRVNVFPTDLHGAVSDDLYVSSLRQGGRASEQVEQFGQATLSAIDAKAYRLAYALGKNHMRDLRPAAEFDLLSERSNALGLPLPASALRYRELRRLESFDAGIHRIHLYEIVHSEKLRDGLTLAHIDAHYAQWRLDHGLPTTVLLR